jgi:hypothetical protein
MFKRVILMVGLVGVAGFLNPVHAQQPRVISWVNCEIGDAIFGKIHFGILTEPT